MDSGLKSLLELLRNGRFRGELGRNERGGEGGEGGEDGQKR